MEKQYADSRDVRLHKYFMTERSRKPGTIQSDKSGAIHSVENDLRCLVNESLLSGSNYTNQVDVRFD